LIQRRKKRRRRNKILLKTRNQIKNLKAKISSTNGRTLQKKVMIEKVNKAPKVPRAKKRANWRGNK